jgi:hypothetical protein
MAVAGSSRSARRFYRTAGPGCQTAPWVPRHGLSSVKSIWWNPPGSQYRDLQQLFQWNSATQLSDLQGSNVTLEVETHVNCPSSCYTGNVAIVWSTNMPNGYFDTQFDDPDDVRLWTVGSSHKGMVADKLYSVFIRTSQGSGTGWGAVRYQRGYVSSPCFGHISTCVFSNGNEFVIPKFVQPLLSDRSWTWP